MAEAKMKLFLTILAILILPLIGIFSPLTATVTGIIVYGAAIATPNVQPQRPGLLRHCIIITAPTPPPPPSLSGLVPLSPPSPPKNAPELVESRILLLMIN